MNARQGTHWDGCYRAHLDCAVAALDDLREAVEACAILEHDPSRPQEQDDELHRRAEHLRTVLARTGVSRAK